MELVVQGVGGSEKRNEYIARRVRWVVLRANEKVGQGG